MKLVPSCPELIVFVDFLKSENKMVTGIFSTNSHTLFVLSTIFILTTLDISRDTGKKLFCRGNNLSKY